MPGQLPGNDSGGGDASRAGENVPNHCGMFPAVELAPSDQSPLHPHGAKAGAFWVPVTNRTDGRTNGQCGESNLWVFLLPALNHAL